MAAALKDAFVRKPVLATIRLVLPAGAARTGPPVSPALGPYRVNGNTQLVIVKDNQKRRNDIPLYICVVHIYHFMRTSPENK
jgi:ribosomal protein L11